MDSSSTHSIPLTGLNGGNPLAYLATLGTFRILSETDNRLKLSWTRQANAWIPVLHPSHTLSNEDLVQNLKTRLDQMADHSVFTFANNPRIPAQRFRALALNAVEALLEQEDPIGQSFLVAFGCDAIQTETGEIEDTALRTMSGAGHQHFLKFMNDLAKSTETSHLQEALFGPWRYRDPGASLRFDPEDDRRYALRWKNPSQDASTTVRGANRLAVEGIPLHPTFPVGTLLETTGFTGHKSNNTFWTWPIWEHPIPLDVCRSLLSLSTLSEAQPDQTELRARGIVATYRSQRITVGKFRNFTPARSV
jgi:hypothetical protein